MDRFDWFGSTTARAGSPETYTIQRSLSLLEGGKPAGYTGRKQKNNERSTHTKKNWAEEAAENLSYVLVNAGLVDWTISLRLVHVWTDITTAVATPSYHG